MAKQSVVGCGVATLVAAAALAASIRDTSADRAAAALPATGPAERVARYEYASRSRVFELDASGEWVAAILGWRSTDDSSQHVIAWNVRTGRHVGFPNGAGSDGFIIARYLGLSLPHVSWSVIYCANLCYHSTAVADIRKPSAVRWGAGEPMEDTWDGSPIYRPGPEPTVRRGVSMAYGDGTLRLRRTRDGRVRTIPAADGALTNAGLFYAHNHGSAPYPGRIIFIPFDQLFR